MSETHEATLSGADTQKMVASSSSIETRMPEVEPSVVAGRVSGPRYEFLKMLAQGGLGRVWVARDADLNREVALKEVRREWSHRPELLARFVREAQVTGQLEHPNIVPVYEMTRRDDGQPFYTMRLLRGKTLRDEVAGHHRRLDDPLGRQKLLSAFVAVCQAVGYAHSRGVIHRDLKTENVMIGPFGEVVVIDWGLAKILGRPDEPEPVTGPEPESGPGEAMASPPDIVLSGEALELATRGTVGTPAYMAPEQVAGLPEAVGFRTDVYSLGAILFEILTGRVPFEGRDLADLYRKIESELAPRARTLAPTVPRAVEAIAVKAMAKAPSDRYARAVDLAEDVQRFLAGEPVSAYPEPWSTRFRRRMARHRVLATAAAASAVVAVLALGIWLADNRVRGLTLVEGLLHARIDQVGALVDQLDGHRTWANPRLRRAFEAGGDPDSKLRAALGLLRVDPGPMDYVYEQMLETPDPTTLGILADALGRDHLAEVVERLRRERPEMGDAARFAASCALATLEPTRPPAPADRSWLVGHLLGLRRVDAASAERWAGLLKPILPAMVPALIALYVDEAREVVDRDFSGNLLKKNARDPKDLAELLQVAEPGDFPEFLGRAKGAQAPVEAILRRVAEADNGELGARRRAQATVALAKLGRVESTWPSLRQSKPLGDPSARWWTVDRLVALGIDPIALADRLEVEGDPSARRAMILALGEIKPSTLPTDRLARLTASLVDRYRDDPDAGTHSAIDWLLRTWGLDGPIRQVDGELAGRPPREDRGWFVSPGGVTFAIVRGPVTFTMGTPEGEKGHSDACKIKPHVRMIDRDFAIATREVTRAEFKRFLDEFRGKLDVAEGNPGIFEEISPTEDCPISVLSWRMAAEYCRWLGDREGREPCYPSVETIWKSLDSGNLKIDPNVLKPEGYRLPTEAEWEYACRAGSSTSRPFGQGDALLGRFAWHVGIAGGRTHPVGGKWPNDFGHFDMLGNIREMVHPSSHELPPNSSPIADAPRLEEIRAGEELPQRGGCYSDLIHGDRSSCQYLAPVQSRVVNAGFRLARTIRRPGPPAR